MSRRSRVGADAAYEMVDIYISPENQSMWQYDENRKDASQAAEHVRAAEHLLAEVRQRREPKHTVLESYVHMARGTKQGYEKAFEMCAEIVNEDHDNVPALLAVALCHMLEKQPTKAKNTLKRVAKLPYNAAEAEEFERAWLTSAELAMEGEAGPGTGFLSEVPPVQQELRQGVATAGAGVRARAEFRGCGGELREGVDIRRKVGSRGGIQARFRAAQVQAAGGLRRRVQDGARETSHVSKDTKRYPAQSADGNQTLGKPSRIVMTHLV